MKKYIIPIIGLSIFVSFIIHLPGILNDLSSPKSPYKVFFGDAETAAKQIVINNLKAPSTAKFQKIMVIEDRIDETRRAHYFLVYISVDAQNSFGAMIREQFLAPLFFKDGDTKSYGLSTETPIASCSAIPQYLEIVFAKALIDWPKEN